MANHVLSLEVPQVMNECILKLLDTSIYQTANPAIPVVCPTLNITVPGFGYSNQIDATNFYTTGSATITACDLQLQTVDCATQHYNLPDGIYIIKYSVSPNDIVYVEYNHLRVTSALNKYYKILCDIDVAACEPPFKVQQRLEELRLIFMYLQAAKSKVEFCHEPQKGMSLYNYALKLLNKMSCSNC